MPLAEIPPRSGFLQLREAAVCPPAQVLVLPVSGFPIPRQELAPVKSFLRSLTAQIVRKWDLSSEVFIQVEQSDEPEGRALYVRHAPRWIPEIGLGVWLDREPPKPWTKEEFMALQPGDKLRPLMYQVLRVTASPQAGEEAQDVLLAFGPILRAMFHGNGESYLERTRDFLLPPISDPSFTCFPCYVPLLDLKGLASTDSHKLTSWFCGASVYIRESFEDQAILIASCEPLNSILNELGGVYEEQQGPLWRIPAE